MRLTVSLEKGIVVVVPKSMNQRRMKKLIPAFVKDKALWLSEVIEKLKARELVKPNIEQCLLPDQITLTALGQFFYIDYEDSYNNVVPQAEGYLPAEGSLPIAEGSITLHHQDDDRLFIEGDLRNKKRVFELLEKFFKTYARHYLKQRLDQLSKEFNLPYNRLSVRAQKTRWGSCSSKKNINLNYRLLFIEKELLDYIVLHELVHTVHMNHSKAFWSYLETLMWDARRRDKQVNQETKNLPCWIFYK